MPTDKSLLHRIIYPPIENAREKVLPIFRSDFFCAWMGKFASSERLSFCPWTRLLPRDRPFDFRTRIKDRRGKLGGPATKPRSAGLFTFEFPPLLGGSSLTLSGGN